MEEYNLKTIPMKNVLMTAATLVVLLSTGALAQRYGYPTPPSNSYPQQPGYTQPGYGQPGYTPGNGQFTYNYDYNDYQFDRHLDWWDRELNLSRRQEREIRRIRERFEGQTRGLNVRNLQQREAFAQLRQRQFFDMMAVLNSDQRNRVIERMRPYERIAGRGVGRGSANGYGQPGNDRRYNPYGY